MIRKIKDQSEVKLQLSLDNLPSAWKKILLESNDSLDAAYEQVKQKITDYEKTVADYHRNAVAALNHAGIKNLDPELAIHLIQQGDSLFLTTFTNDQPEFIQ